MNNTANHERLCASFDIGQKNLAYVVVDLCSMSIKKWITVNLISNAKQSILESCLALSDVLEQERLFTRCETVLVERQLKANAKAITISQHLWTWFHARHGIVSVFVPAQARYKHFAAPCGLSYKKRKDWAVNACSTIVAQTFSTHAEATREFFAARKKDDLADCLLQLLAHINFKF